MRSAGVMRLASGFLACLSCATVLVVVQIPPKIDVNWDGIRPNLREAATSIQKVTFDRVQDRLSGSFAYRRPDVVRKLEEHRDRVLRILDKDALEGARAHVRSFTATASRTLTPTFPPGGSGTTAAGAAAGMRSRSGVDCGDCVTIDSATRAIVLVGEKTTAMANTPSIVVDLKTMSVPSEARLQLQYLTSNSQYRETTTNNGMPNVYRGQYRVVVEKAGYSRGTLVIDLFDDPGTTLSCDLQLASGSQSSTCRLMQ